MAATTENEQDLLWVYNPTKATFTVYWGGYPYTLKSGEKKIMPRFIATHFAKHLADAILLRKEEQEFEKTGKRKNYVRHPIERPRIVAMIILDVYSYHQPESRDAGAIIANMVEQANQGVDSSQAPAAPQEEQTVYEDFGLIPNPAIGNLAPPPDPEDEIDAPPAPDPTDTGMPNDGSLLGMSDETTPASSSIGAVDPPAPTPGNGKKPKSREELLAEAEELGIENYKKMNTTQLEAAIRNF